MKFVRNHNVRIDLIPLNIHSTFTDQKVLYVVKLSLSEGNSLPLVYKY